MSGPPAEPTTAPPGAEVRRGETGRDGALRDVALILVVLCVAGVVAGVVWPQLVDPVTATRSAAGVGSPETELVKLVQADGWFAAIGFATCLVLALVLSLWRRHDEVVTLVTLVAGSLLAAWLCAFVGGVLGPDPAAEVLAQAGVGATAPDELVVSAKAAYLAWPLGAVVGSLFVLLGMKASTRAATRRSEQVSAPTVS